MLITVVFGMLAYRNVRQITYRVVPLVRRELEKQLTNMVLVQVAWNFVMLTPYSVVIGLSVATSVNDDPNTAAQLALALNIASCLYYLYFAVRTNEIISLFELEVLFTE